MREGGREGGREERRYQETLLYLRTSPSLLEAFPETSGGGPSPLGTSVQLKTYTGIDILKEALPSFVIS